MYISYSNSVQVLLLTSNNGSVLSEINQREERIKRAVIFQLYFCFALMRKKKVPPLTDMLLVSNQIP
jgi:hypothetical protein